MRATPRDERGSVTPLIIGFMLVVAMLVAVVVDASAAYLRRQSLHATADAAALAATQALQGERVYTEGLGRTAELDPVAARQHVAAYVARSGARQRWPGLDWRVRTAGDTVVVRLTAPLDLPLQVPGVGDGWRISGEAASVVVVDDR